MNRPALALLLILSACSTGQTLREADVLKPEVLLVQTSMLGESMRESSPVEVHYRVFVKNNSSEAITLRQLDVRTVSSGSYALNANTVMVNLLVPPLATGDAPFHVRGFGRGGAVGEIEPVLVRVITYFETEAGPFHHVFTQRIDPGSSNRPR